MSPASLFLKRTFASLLHVLSPPYTQKVDTQALREQCFKHLEEIVVDEQRRQITFAAGVFWILDWGGTPFQVFLEFKAPFL